MNKDANVELAAEVLSDEQAITILSDEQMGAMSGGHNQWIHDFMALFGVYWEH